MADENIQPINPNQLTELDTLDETVQPLQPDFVDQLEAQQVTGGRETAIRAGQSALLKGLAGDEPTLDREKLQSDGRRAADEAAQRFYDELMSQNDAFLNGVRETAIAPEAVIPHITQGMQERNIITENRSSPTATEKAIVEQSSASAEELLKKEKEFQLAARNDIALMLDSQGMLDTALDFTGYFLPFGEVKDIVDIKGEIIESEVLRDVLSGQSIEGMVASFHALSTERKAAVWPEVQKAVIRATGTEFAGVTLSDKNITKAAGLLLQFLAPSGGDRLQGQATLDTVFGVADVLPAGLLGKLKNVSKLDKTNMEKVLRTAAAETTRTTNTVKTANDLGSKKMAATVNIKAMVDEAIAETSGMSKQQARDNALPTRATPFDPEKAEGLSAAMSEQLNEFQQQAQGFTRSMTVESDLLTIGALDKSDRKKVVKNFIQDMERRGEDLLTEGVHLTNVRVLNQDEKGFEFAYDIVNNKVQTTKVLKRKGVRGFQRGQRREQQVTVVQQPQTQTGRISWRVNQNTGHYGETTDDLIRFNGGTLGRSPSAWSKVGTEGKLDFGDTVKQAIQLADVSVAIQTRVNNLWLDANKTIRGVGKTKQRQLLEAIELKGDEFIHPDTQAKGKVFNTVELNTMGLTDPDAQVAYYKRRVVADQLHAMQNFATRRELELAGFGQTRVLGQEVLAKMFDTPAAALKSLSNKRGFKILRQDTREVVDWDAESINAAYEKGQRLVRTREDFNTTGAGDMATGGERVEYILINDAKRMRSLPEQVVPYHQGYVPKIQENVEFVLRQRQRYAKAGVPDAHRTVALRAFSSRKELETFRAQLVEDELLKLNMVNKSPDDVARVRAAIDAQYEVADGSVMSQVERMENALSSSQGLFVGTRSAGDLALGLKGVPIERMSPSDAFGRYFSHLGRTISMNEWRVGSEQKWMNTVRKYQDQLGGVEIKGFANTQLNPDNPTAKALIQLRDQIKVWNGTPTREESLYQMWIQGIHDWALTGVNKLGLDKANVKSVLWLKHADPIQALKTSNMHLFLGSLNPAQIYVQASAMTVALSTLRVSDVPGVIATGFKFHMLDNIQDATALKGAYTFLARNGVITPDDVAKHKVWQRTGLRESIRANADMDVLSSTGLGVAGDFARNAGNVSLVLYRTGELANRRVSFLSALENWLQAKPGRSLDKISNDELSAILTEANKTMLELNAANKAWWQGGANATATQQVLGLATQFMQVTTKTMELATKGVARGGFTPAMKRRIGLAQLGLFGAAGVPLLNAVAPSMFEWIGAEPTPEVANAINQGVSGVFVREFLGADVDIANRAALGGQIFQTLKDVVASDDPLWLLAFGVAGESGSRFGRAMNKLAPLMLADNRSQKDLTTAELEEAITALATELPSTGRNLMKAYIMHRHDRVLDRRGRPVVSKDFSLATEVFAGLGFRPTDETRTRMLQLDNRDYDDLTMQYAQTIIDMHHDWVFKYDRDEKHGQILLNKRQYLLETIDDSEMIRRVNDLVSKRVFETPDSLQTRELKKFWERTAADEVTEGIMLDSGLMDSLLSREQAITQPFQQIVDEEE